LNKSKAKLPKTEPRDWEPVAQPPRSAEFWERVRNAAAKAPGVSRDQALALSKKAKGKIASGYNGMVDTSEVGDLTEEELAAGFRPGAKQLVAMRLDRDVLEWLKTYGAGYSTRINGILRHAMKAARKAG
jgi:uncharacterized protein (DUF4415 family)